MIMKLYVATKLRTVTLRKSAKGSVEKKDVHLDEQITGIMHEVKKKHDTPWDGKSVGCILPIE